MYPETTLSTAIQQYLQETSITSSPRQRNIQIIQHIQYNTLHAQTTIKPKSNNNHLPLVNGAHEEDHELEINSCKE